MCVVRYLYCIPFITLEKQQRKAPSHRFFSRPLQYSVRVFIWQRPVGNDVDITQLWVCPFCPTCSDLGLHAGTDCIGLGVLCFPFLLFWIVPICQINVRDTLYPSDPSLEARVLCAILSPISLAQVYMCPPTVSPLVPIPPGFTILLPCARHSMHPLPLSPIILSTSPLLAEAHHSPPLSFPPCWVKGEISTSIFPLFGRYIIQTVGSTGRAERKAGLCWKGLTAALDSKAHYGAGSSC